MLRLIIILLVASLGGPLYISYAEPAGRAVGPDHELSLHDLENINDLYGGLKIVSLSDLPTGRFSEYKKYVQNGTAHIIVHPAYYIFFHDFNDRKIVIERQSDDFSKNIVDIFIEDYPVGGNRTLQEMRESQKLERAFLRDASSNGKLVILVLPPNYTNHHDYPYQNIDEFGRYLNEVTKGAPSVVYIESRGHESGYVSKQTLSKLDDFLKETGVNTLFLGGGYVGLCLENFFNEANKLGLEKVEILPGLSTRSPDFMMR